MALRQVCSHLEVHVECPATRCGYQWGYQLGVGCLDALNASFGTLDTNLDTLDIEP
jgi:hypothetical protein